MTLNSKDQSASDFSADCVNDIKKNSMSKSLGISAMDYIRYMFPVQIFSEVLEEENRNSNDLDGLYQAVKEFEQGKNIGVEIGVYGKYWSEEHAAHALWGVRTIDEGFQSKIVVYDCNHPNEERYIYLSRDASGKFTSWSYDPDLFGASIFGTNQKGKPEIKFVTFTGTFYDMLREKLHGHRSVSSTGFTDRNLVALSTGTITSENSLSKIEIKGLIEKSEEDALKENMTEYYWSDRDSIDFSGNSKGLSASLIGKTSSIELLAKNGKSATLSLNNHSDSSMELKTSPGDTVSATFATVASDDSVVTRGIAGMSGTDTIDAYVDGNDTIIRGMSSLMITVTESADDVNGNSSILSENKMSIDKMNPEHSYCISENKDDTNTDIIIKEDTNGDGEFDLTVSGLESSDKPSNPNTSDTGIKQDGGDKVDHNIPTKGSYCKVGVFQYKITKSAAKNGTVTLTKLLKKSKTKITIPAKVKVNGYTFKVTEVGTKAFQNCKKLRRVTIGENVKSIGKKAFCGCSKLRGVVVAGSSLKNIKASAFRMTNIKMTVRFKSKKVTDKKRTMLLKKMKKAGMSKSAKLVKY